MELSFYGVNDQGKALGGTHSVLDLTLRPETRERVNANGVRVNPRVNLPPGRYQLRIGARERVGGLSGTVFYDSMVPDFRKEKLMIGGLLLAAASSQQTPSIQPDPIVRSCCRLRDEPPRISARRHARAVHGDLRQHHLTPAPSLSTYRCGCCRKTAKRCYTSHDELANAASPLKSRGKFTGIPNRFL